MSTDPRAGQPAEPRDLIDVPRVVLSYYTEHPDPGEAAQRVAFGTSGHRGSSLNAALSDEPRWPDVPKATRCAGSPGSGRSV